MTHTPQRMRSVLCATLCATSFALTPAAVAEPVTDVAQYARWHASAVAFSNTADKISPRYGTLDMAEVGRARQLIAAAEQAAQQRDHATASRQARQAYEMLRAAIAAAAERKNPK